MAFLSKSLWKYRMIGHDHGLGWIIKNIEGVTRRKMVVKGRARRV